MSSQAIGADPLDLVSKSVLFIYDGNTKPCESESGGTTLLPLGSGLVVGIPSAESSGATWKGWKFLVTSHHVLDGKNEIILRLNSKDNLRFVCYRLAISRDRQSQNMFASKRREVDIILVHMPDIADTDPTVFDYSLIADDATYKSHEIRVGTEVYTVGYLYGYSGQKQNYPVAKFGKVALITEEKWYRAPAPRSGDEYAYLIELQNTPGLSGAPIILRSEQYRIADNGQFQYRRVQPYVLGVIKGLLLSPTGSQGVASVEPGKYLKEMLKDIAEQLRKNGLPVAPIAE